MLEIKIALFTESKKKKSFFASIKILEHGKIDANDSLLVFTSDSSSGWLHKEDDTYFAFFIHLSIFTMLGHRYRYYTALQVAPTSRSNVVKIQQPDKILGEAFSCRFINACHLLSTYFTVKTDNFMCFPPLSLQQ